MRENGVYSGPDAIKQFLDPDNLPNIPLVELPETLNPLAIDGVRIQAKMMNLLPLGNVKAAPAYNMIAQAAARGELEHVERLIENSSGNTVSSLAIAARHFGINRTNSYVPAEISWSKIVMLLFFGIEPIVNEEPQAPEDNDPRTGVYKARKAGEEDDTLNPGQYENDDNPASHEKWTGPQIWEQTEGKISVLCAGLGTCGTIIGTATALKKMKPDLLVVGALRAPNKYVPGVRTEKLLNVVEFDWRAHVDHMEPVDTETSYRLSMEMCRLGLMVGPSSGLALAGALQFLTAQKYSGGLDALRNDDGEVICVFPCPDGPLPYLEEYFKYVERSQFPSIQNEELLINKP